MKKFRYATLREYSDFCRSNKDCYQCRLWELCPYSSAVEHIAEDIYPTNWRYDYELTQLMRMSDEKYLKYCLAEFKNDKKEESEYYDEWRFERMEIRLCCFNKNCGFYNEIYVVKSKLSSDLLENDYEPRNLDYLSKYLETEIRKILRCMREASND